MEHDDVVYDQGTMSVKASNFTWIELCESFDLAIAYHQVGVERMWHELNAIFGPDDAPDPSMKSMLPPKPQRAFELIRPNGRRLPTIDELLADIMEEEKRMWDEKVRKDNKKRGIVEVSDPADCMSLTKSLGRELAPARDVIIISPEMAHTRASTASGAGCSRAKRCLPF